jgi:hypothetical protein
MTQPRRGLRHISDILRDITEAERPPEPTREIKHPFNRHCGCAECMRIYLNAVQRGAV